MTHRTFIVREEIAELVGLNAAILHERLKYMVEQNAQEGRKMVDGVAWVNCTYEDWAEYVPLLSVKQIRTAFEKLIEAGLVVSGRHGRHVTDRTLWYTLATEAQDVASSHLPKRANGTAREGKSTSAHMGKSTSAREGKSYKETDSLRNQQEPSAPAARVSFPEFWKVWPNKVGKHNAERAWKKLTSGDRERALSLAASFFAKWRAANASASPIHAATYLNQKRWTDYEPEVAASAEDRDAQIAKMLASPIAAVREAAQKMQEAAE